MADNRRVRWLGATLVLALAALIVVRSLENGPAPRAARVRTTPPAPAVVEMPPSDVRLETLNQAHGEPAAVGRNPFQFEARRVVADPAAAPRVAAVPDDQVDAPRTPPLPPPPPPIPLKFIGLVEKADGTRIAVLSDGKRPISGQEGEELEGRYKILKIGTESIELSYLDGRGRQTIRLTGQ